MLAPVLFRYGTPEQQRHYLPRMLSGEHYWCQGYSEPGSGSDLSSLQTSAVRDGDDYLVNGTKIWTTHGHFADHIFCLVRTDASGRPQAGISLLLIDMATPGISVQPIVTIAGDHEVNQVFFDDVRIPVANRVGDEGDGWRLAKVTLSNERVSLSSAGSMWGVGPSAEHLLHLVREAGGLDDPILRQRAMDVHIEAELLRLNRFRSLSATLQGKTPGPEASIQKIMADDHGQHVLALAKDLAGANGMIEGSGPEGEVPSSMHGTPTENRFKDVERPFPTVDSIWHYGYLFSPALTLGGGTFAVQRNIVAEHVLGLPREPNLERGMSWSEANRARSGS
jgi:alkylation response protein AidB-like acyl-CoA dehydrogenase